MYWLWEPAGRGDDASGSHQVLAGSQDERAPLEAAVRKRGGKDMSSALATIRRSAPLAMGPDEALTSDAFFAQLEQDHPVKVHAPCMRDLPRPPAPVEGRAGALHTVRVTDPRTCQRPPAAPRCRAARVLAMRVGFPCMVARRGSGALRKHFHVQTADGGVGNRGPGD